MNKEYVDYQAELRERLKAEGIRDEGFIETFFEGQGDLAREIHAAAQNGPAFVDDALQGIADTAKSHYFIWNRRGSPSVLQSDEIAPKRSYKRRKKSRTSDAWERQESLAKYLTTRMRPAGSALVGGRLLSPEEASAFLDSPIAASYPKGFIAHYGLDATLNPAAIEEGEDKRGPYRVLRAVGELGTHDFKIRPLGRNSKGPVFSGDGFEGLDFAGIRRTPKAGIVFVVHPHNSKMRVVAKANSVLAQLNEATNRMQSEPISPEKALWFILTGEFIPEPPVRIRSLRRDAPGWYRRTKITLEVEGWMTAEEVADHYRHAQRQIFGKIPRSLDAKSRALLDFVNQNKGMTWNKDTTWQQLYDKWNKKRPGWSFKQVGHLYQLHKNAFRKLVNGD